MERHIVVAGQSRSGSTLFYNMLRNTLKGFQMVSSEAPTLPLLDTPGNICTKRPFDIFDIPKIVERAKGKKRIDLIVTLRDPRDVLTSRHKAVPDDYFIAADRCYFVPEGRTPEFTAPGFLPVHDAIVKAVSPDYFPQGVFLLKYEHLIEDPDRIQAKLADAYGLEFEGSFADFHKHDVPLALQGPLNGVRPVDHSRMEKWRKPEHRDRIIEQFTSFPQLHDVLEGLGYEKDRTWFEQLLDESAGPAASAVGA